MRTPATLAELAGLDDEQAERERVEQLLQASFEIGRRGIERIEEQIIKRLFSDMGDSMPAADKF